MIHLFNMFNMFLFNIVLFSEMSLYNQCLISVVLNGDYKTDDLPHTIQDDVAVLQCFKNMLHDWNATFEMINQIHQREDMICYTRNCDCSYDMDCGCNPYNDFEECEPYNTRLKKEEEDLGEELDQLQKEILCIKDKIPTQLKDVARKIVNKMDGWLCFLPINLE